MSGNNSNFTDWACDPALTLEPRYGALRLIEASRGHWERKHGIPATYNYEADRLRAKGRSLDPSFKPSYSRADAERTAEVLAEITNLSFHSHEDRIIRDVSFLRFVPQLTNLSFSGGEVDDWSPLAGLKSLTILHLVDDSAIDLGVLGELTSLDRLQLFLRTPWPELAGLERLTRLRHLHYSGNLLALKNVPSLPGVRVADFSHGRFNVPLRSLLDLPEMPDLRALKVDNTARLDGIGRYPRLVNLESYGYYRDIRPLEALQDLTHLFLSGGDYPDIIPVSRMRNLCRVTLRIELPPDLTPLADLARLHEIRLEITPVVPAELHSLNSLCAPWDDEFAVVPPRPLEPLRLCIRKAGARRKIKARSRATPRDWAEDEQMATSEGRWFVRKLNRSLRRLLGKGWPKESEKYPPDAGHMQVHIYRREDIDRLPAIIHILRQLIASARHPWEIIIVVNSLGEYERDLDEITGEDEDEFDAERERQEWEYGHRLKLERQDFLKRKYEHRLAEELGVPLRPPAPTEVPAAAESPETTAESTGPEYDLGTSLELYAFLTESAVTINGRDRGLAELLLEMKADEDPVDDDDGE